MRIRRWVLSATALAACAAVGAGAIAASGPNVTATSATLCVRTDGSVDKDRGSLRLIGSDVQLSWKDGSPKACKDNEQQFTLAGGQAGPTYTAGAGLALAGTTFSVADDGISFSKIHRGAVQGEAGAGTQPLVGNIALGSIAKANLADDSVEGGQGGVVKDGTITGADISPGAVATNQIGGGAVTAPKLATGAVSTDKQTANFGSSTSSAFTLTIDNPSPTAQSTSTFVSIQPTGTSSASTHAIALNGQLQISSTGSRPAAGEVLTVEWQIMDGSTAVSPTYSGQLTATNTSFAGAVSFVTTDAVEGAMTTYTLRVKVTGSVSGPRAVDITDATLNAIDLGRTS